MMDNDDDLHFLSLEWIWSNKERCMSDPSPLSISVDLIGSLLMIFLGSKGENHQQPEWTSAAGQTDQNSPWVLEQFN